jgi:hypothetical protein
VKHLVELWRGGKHTGAELAEQYGVACSAVSRAMQCADETSTRSDGDGTT